MKKILSVLLSVAMLVGMVVPALATATEGEAYSFDVSSVGYFEGGSTFESAVSVTKNGGDLCGISLFVWWEGNVVESVELLSDMPELIDFESSSAGAKLESKAKATQNPQSFKDVGITKAGYYGYEVVIYAALDEDGAYIPFDTEIDNLAKLSFTMADGIAVGDTFEYNAVIETLYDSADEEIEEEYEPFVVTTTVTATPALAALQEEYADQGLTFVLTNAEFDEEGFAETKLYAVNNENGFNSVTFILAYSNAVTLSEVKDGVLFGEPESEFNTNFTVDDEMAIGQAVYAFECFNYDYEGSTDNFAILYYKEEADNDGDSLGDNIVGDGYIFSVVFEASDSVIEGKTYPVLLMADYEGGVVDFDGANITQFALVNGAVKVPGELSCQHETTRDQIKTEASCEGTGLKDVYCASCGELLESDVVIPALGHVITAMAEVDATCTEDGSTGGTYCSRCTNVLTAATVVPKLGHDLGDWQVIEEATTTAAGLQKRFCARCDYFETAEIPMLKEVHFALEDLTATENCEIALPVKVTANPGFWAAKLTLAVDDGLEVADVASGLFEITEDNYTFANGVLTVFVDAATLEDVAVEEALFTVYFVPTRATGAYDVTLTVDEVIDAAGADVLNVVDNNAVVTITACEHNFVRTVVTEPTVTEEGLAELVCSICGKTETEIVPVLVSLNVADAQTEVGTETAVAVELVNNSGLWSLSAEFAFDTEALEFVGVESGLFEVSEDSYSETDGVVKVFVDNSEIADVTEDGTAFTLVFNPLKEGTCEVVATVVDANTINAAGDFVKVAAAKAGTITVGAYVPVAKALVADAVARVGATTEGVDFAEGTVTVTPIYGADYVEFALKYVDSTAVCNVESDDFTVVNSAAGFAIIRADFDCEGTVTITAANGDYEVITVAVGELPTLGATVLVDKAVAKAGATDATYSEGAVAVATAYGAETVKVALAYKNAEAMYSAEEVEGCEVVSAGKGFVVITAEAGATASLKLVDKENLAYEVVTFNVDTAPTPMAASLVERAVVKSGATGITGEAGYTVNAARGAETVRIAFAYADAGACYNATQTDNCTVVSAGPGFVVVEIPVKTVATLTLAEAVYGELYETISITVTEPAAEDPDVITLYSAKAGIVGNITADGKVINVTAASAATEVTFVALYDRDLAVISTKDCTDVTFGAGGPNYVRVTVSCEAENPTLAFVDAVSGNLITYSINITK